MLLWTGAEMETNENAKQTPNEACVVVARAKHTVHSGVYPPVWMTL